jgi:hypothetical protein
MSVSKYEIFANFYECFNFIDNNVSDHVTFITLYTKLYNNLSNINNNNYNIFGKICSKKIESLLEERWSNWNTTQHDTFIKLFRYFFRHLFKRMKDENYIGIENYPILFKIYTSMTD